MSRRLVLAVLMSALVGFAGCLGEYGGDVDAAPPQPPSSGSGSTDRSGAPSPEVPPYEPPAEPSPRDDPHLEASLTASVQNGTAPLSVTFTLDGNRSDGAVVTWIFDAYGNDEIDGSGTAMPQNLTFVYEVGHHNATLRVTDGNETLEVTVQIVAWPLEVVGPPDPIWINGTITGAWLRGVGYLPYVNNHTFELPVPVTNFTVRLSFGGTAIDLDYEVYAPGGREVARHASYNEPTGELPPPFRGPGEPQTHVRGADAKDTGTWAVQVMPALSVEGDYSIRILFF